MNALAMLVGFDNIVCNTVQHNTVQTVRYIVDG